ncbi:MAG: hypothetical protein Q9160_007556 [Pyrenula sp. 1 TL-2023]
MFSSTGLFADTPCPQGQDCVLLRCIFCHDVVVDEKSNEIGSAASTKADEESQESAFKRRRIDYGDDSPQEKIEKNRDEAKVTNRMPPVPSEVLDGSVDSIRSRTNHHVKKESKVSHDQNLLSAKRPISPPTIRGRNIGQDHTDTSTRSKQNPVHGNTEFIKAKNAKEQLNPRAVRPSPATHPVRLAILQQLHKAMVAQNENASKEPRHSSLLLLSPEELITMALDEEENIARDNPSIYTNVIKQRVMRTRKMALDEWQSTIRAKVAPQATQTLPHKPATNSHRTPSRNFASGLTAREELQVLRRLRTPLEGLESHGYITNPPSDAEIESARSGIKAADGFEKCERCGTRFQVFPGRREDGVLTTHGACVYHWAKIQRSQWSRMDAITGSKEAFYPCCKESIGTSSGCTSSPHHVFKVTDAKRLGSILQFARTPAKSQDGVTKKTKGAITFDCEMGYTTMGIELIRLTAVAWPLGQELLDVLVRPFGEILDLNTRFSGVTSEQMTNAIPYGQQPAVYNGNMKRKDSDNISEDGEIESEKPLPLRITSSPDAARQLLFDLLSPGTPLMGHAIDNDLNATRIIHPYIIDTVLLYPHPRKLPIRYSLKMLTSKYLERDIQISGAHGHDSKEDAVATGDLVRLKVAEKWKQMHIQGWRFENGLLIEPEKGTIVPSGPRTLAGGKRTVSELEDEQAS